jgi:thermopsin
LSEIDNSAHVVSSAPRVVRGGLVIAVAFLVVSLALAGLGGGSSGVLGASGGAAGPAPATSAAASVIPTHVLTPGLAELADRLASTSALNRVPAAERLLPNLEYSSVREGNAIVPVNLLPAQVSPGPTSIGVNDLGLRSTSTGYQPYWYRTTSLDGAVTITNISLLPIMTNASASITLQLNSILNNVTFFGQPIYQLWLQNVIFYSVAGDQMQLATDAWNFTGAPFALFQNDIYENSPGGFLFSGTYVHAVPSSPPAFHLAPPFTINFYLNATNVGGRNAIFFNYSLVSAHDITLGTTNYGHSIQDGSFDWIIFNSTAGQPAGYVAPPSSFLISGNQTSNLGLPDDAEIAVCGGSDGFSGITRELSGSAQLTYLNGTTGRYSAVPAAFTTTEDTGESMEGVDAHYTAASARDGLAYLTNGPEFVYGLWNASAPGSHEQRFQVSASPDQTQVWVSPKSGSGFDEDTAAWDLAPGAASSFWLPFGGGISYDLEAMANDYSPLVRDLAASGPNNLSLAYDASEGLYVPIIAFGNAQVADIAQAGTGTAAHPYVVSYPQYRPISSMYSTYDIFTQPLYPGVLLSGVTAHVVLQSLPTLAVRLSAEAKEILRSYYGLTVPNQNDLPIEVYDSSNVAIVGDSHLAGWFPVTLTGFLYASLFLSNDSNMLVAYNHFYDTGSSMVIVDPNGNSTLEHNTVFGNIFQTSTIASKNTFYIVYPFNTTFTGPPAIGALGVFASGNLVYNNLFETPITTWSPPQNPYLAYVYINDFGYTNFSSVASVWHNRWNIEPESASHVRMVDGFALTGSIVNAPFQGGNAYSNFNGTIPYTDDGLIVTGGDALPLPVHASPVHAVVFEEYGLPRGDAFTVVFGGVSYRSVDGLVILYVANGTTAHYTVPPAFGFRSTPDHGTVRVTTHDVFVPLDFT